MKRINTLCYNKRVSLMEMVWEEQNVESYVFSHETRCDGKIISILPFRITDAGEIEILILKEAVPCWNVNNNDKLQLYICSVTGGVENNDPLNTAIEELYEETGYIVNEDEMIFLGNVFGTKSTDTVYYLYAVDLTNKIQHEKEGDGTILEEFAQPVWSTPAIIAEADDFLLYVLWIKFSYLIQIPGI